MQADAMGFFNRKVLKSPTKTWGEAVSWQKYTYKRTAREMFSLKKWKYTIYVNPNSAQKRYNLASFNSHFFYLCSLQWNIVLLIRHDFLTCQPLEQTNEGSCARTICIQRALQRGTYIQQLDQYRQSGLAVKQVSCPILKHCKFLKNKFLQLDE